jgi:hypothetical protein
MLYKMLANPQTVELFGDVGRLIACPPAPKRTPTGPVIYLCDLASGRLDVLWLSADAFAQLADQAIAMALTFKQACSALCTFMDQVEKGKLTVAGKARDVLVGVAALYLRGTESYAAAKNWDSVHYIVVRYPPLQPAEHFLRPIPVISVQLLTHAEIESAVEKVLQIDRARHPLLLTASFSSRFRIRTSASDPSAQGGVDNVAPTDHTAPQP